MEDDDFEWDDAKATQNFASHGVSFEAARLAFDDPLPWPARTDVTTTAKIAISYWAWSKTACSQSLMPNGGRAFGSSRPE
jgi:uncharacterized DUF497 family protein